MSSNTNGKAHTNKSTFSRTTSIQELILADKTAIWSLLTNATQYPEWNSTIISIQGKIEPGSKIQLKSPLAPERTFKLKVKEVIPEKKLVWGDAMGTRTYSLSPADKGVLFSMSETIGGPLFPLFASKIPDFDASFEQFTADLKKAAEK